MFPLAATDFPASATALAESLQAGLLGLLTPPAGREMVSIDAPAFPEADRLGVDLTGCQLIEEAARPPRNLHGFRPAVSVQRFVLTATPLLIRTASLRVDLAVSDVRFDYARDDQDRLFLVPATDAAPGGGEGQVKVAMDKADIEALLIDGLKPLAAANGVGIEDAQVEFTSESPRSVRLHVSAVGKKLFVKAKIHVYGRLQIDDELVAVADQLKCEGDGFVGEMAQRLIQPRLDAFNGTTVPLAGFSLGGLKLRDVNINVAEGLEVTAKLGG